MTGHAGRAPRARQGQKPVPERGLAQRRAPVALQLHPVRVLHGALWREPRHGRLVAGVLGPRPRHASRTPQIHHFRLDPQKREINTRQFISSARSEGQLIAGLPIRDVPAFIFAAFPALNSKREWVSAGACFWVLLLCACALLNEPIFDCQSYNG